MVNGIKSSGVKTIYPYKDDPGKSAQVYCDQETDGGGWAVILRRDQFPKMIAFYSRTWDEYANGFGDLEKEFYAGNDLIHALTESGNTKLRVDLADFEGNERFAKYGAFYVGDAFSKYKLLIIGYEGNAGDSFGTSNDSKFSTKDQDNDYADFSCAEL